MGNTSAKHHSRQKNKKQVHWKAADRPGRPGKPQLISDTDGTPDVITIRWDRPLRDGGSPIVGYLVEHRRTGSPHWVRASPTLVPIPELTLSGLEPGWRYQFRVTAENAVGLSDPSELSEPLAVTLQRSVVTSPRFTQELLDTIALENDKVEFVTYFVGQPPPKISWFKDGFEIFSSRRIRILTESDRSVLTIHQSQLVDAGEIRCSATNKAGHATTKSILILEAPPTIRLPRQYEDGLLFDIGEVMRLKISVAGLPVPLIFWSHNGESIQNGERYEIETYENSTTLRIEEAKREDRGEYQVKAINKLGQDQASFLVTVTDKPSSPGKARVLMTLGRSVTLAWNTPEDDGGCKIGNYIIEYYRLGWDVWLKAATSRQLNTVLGDLIEGSQYKFRVKAESPYGISEPSEESDVIFIPDTKRGIVTPPPRSASQPGDTHIHPERAPDLPLRKNKPRSQSSSRVEDHHVQFNFPNSIPVRPERGKLKSPLATPDQSPAVVRRELNQQTVNKNIFDRASIARDLSYGTPFKVTKLENEMLNSDKLLEAMEQAKTRSTIQIIDNNNRSPSPSVNKPSSTGVKEYDSVKELRESRSKSPGSMKLFAAQQQDRSPSPEFLKQDKPSSVGVKEHDLVKELLDTRSSSTSPMKLFASQQQDRSPSPEFLKQDTEMKIVEKASTPSPIFPRKSKDFTGSSEFMLVLLPNGDSKDTETSNIELSFDESMIPPPLSLSAPELGTEPPVIEGLKYSASSTELLHERAMIRFYEAAKAEELELKRKLEKKDSRERRSSIIPKIKINSQDEDDIDLDRQASLRRRYSGGLTAPHQVLWAQKRHSLRNSEDVDDFLEGKLKRYAFAGEGDREIILNKSRLEYQEQEYTKIEKVGSHNNSKQLQTRASDVVDLSKLDEYEESVTEEESSDEERIYDEVAEPRRSEEEEDVTYHPMMRTVTESKIKSNEPFEILTKPNKLPDPNFIPKPILKRGIEVDLPTVPKPHDFTAEDLINRRRPSSPLLKTQQKISTLPKSNSNKMGKRGSLPWSAPLALAINEDSNNKETELGNKLLPNIASIASVSAVAAAGFVIPKSMLAKKAAEEEAKVVADHYGDIVRSYSKNMNQPTSKKQNYQFDTTELVQQPPTSAEPPRNTIKPTQILNKEVAPATPLSEERHRTNVSAPVVNAHQSALHLKDTGNTMNQMSTNYNGISRSRTNSSSSSQSSSSKLERMRRGSPTVLNRDVERVDVFRVGRDPKPPKKPTSRSSSRTRTPSKSPGRRKKRSESPNVAKEKVFAPTETSTFSTQTETAVRRAPTMKEIMTQTSTSLDTFTPAPYIKRNGLTQGKYYDMQLQKYAEKKVRTTVDYVTDIAMFILACWLYFFSNELLAIPPLLIMVYRQLQAEIKRRLPHWLRTKTEKQT